MNWRATTTRDPACSSVHSSSFTIREMRILNHVQTLSDSRSNLRILFWYQAYATIRYCVSHVLIINSAPCKFHKNVKQNNFWERTKNIWYINERQQFSSAFCHCILRESRLAITFNAIFRVSRNENFEWIIEWTHLNESHHKRIMKSICQCLQ